MLRVTELVYEDMPVVRLALRNRAHEHGLVGASGDTHELFRVVHLSSVRAS